MEKDSFKKCISYGQMLNSKEKLEKEVGAFIDYCNQDETGKRPSLLLHEFAKTRPWGKPRQEGISVSDLNALRDYYLLSCFFGPPFLKEKDRPGHNKAEKEELNEIINQKRWAKAKNLGKGKGIPQGWTLCEIGPNNDRYEASGYIWKKLSKKTKEDTLPFFFF